MGRSILGDKRSEMSSNLAESDAQSYSNVSSILAVLSAQSPKRTHPKGLIATLFLVTTLSALMHQHVGILLMAPPGGGADAGSSGISTIIMFVVIGIIFYMMIYRPQKKRQKEREALVNQMEKGDKVITSHGMHGTIHQIEDNTVLLQVADNTKIRMEKASIATVVNKKSDKIEKSDKDKS